VIPLGVALCLGLSVPTLAAPAGPAAGPAPPEPAADLPFAHAGPLDLFPPARRVVAYTYHQSPFRSALRLQPLGRATTIDNPAFHRRPPTPGPSYIVMGSRHRGTPATSAADVVLRRRTPVVAPVSGRVVDVTAYRLYCHSFDIRVIIRPDGFPRRRVVLFHVDRLRVHPGDRVEVGTSRIGIPRYFPNSSRQTDQYVGRDVPHVHVEVERRPVRPLPGCRL
jgi:hypothetical protein